MGVGTALIASAVIGAGTAVYSASASKKASAAGAKAMTASSYAAMNTEWEMYQQAREDFAPWRDAGERSLSTAEGMINEGPGEFKPKEQPGYEFGYKNFVEKPYLSGQSAKGKRLSGETMKGLIGYAQDYATTSYDNFLDRYYKKLNPFLQLAGTGQIAAGGSANTAQATGNAVAGLQTNIGQVQSQNALNQAAISGQAAQNVGSAATGLISGLSYAGNLSGGSSNLQNLQY